MTYTHPLQRRALIKALGIGLASYSVAPVLSPIAQADKRITLTAKAGTAPITNGQTDPTQIWGYDGQVPGPVLRAIQGERLNVRLLNELEQPTSIHWHGIRIENAMDGSPLVQEPVPPGEHFDYSFTVPDAGTYWYHTHTRGFEQLTRGLYGVLIVDESATVTDQYDEDKILVFDDWRLDDNGQIEEDNIGAMMHMSHAGRMGNWGSVNGTNKPQISVPRDARIRARFLNVCNARILNIDLGDLDAWVIAHDGQPSGPSALRDTLSIAPGQRTDVVIDIPRDAPPSYPIDVKVRDTVYPAATLKVGAKSAQESTSKRTRIAPAALPDNPLHAQRFALDKAHAVKLHMQGGAMGGMSEARYQDKMLDIRSLVQQGRVWAFNGVSDMDKSTEPLFSVPGGTTVTIDIHNDTNWPHAMHTHGHHFRVIEINGETVEPGPWRDTHLMQPAEQHTIAFVADNPGDWLMHCHMVEHAASGMTGWFRVT